jgi:hypothetical protein
MKIATSFLAALLLVGSLITGVVVWLLRVTIEVNARNITLTGLLYGRWCDRLGLISMRPL